MSLQGDSLHIRKRCHDLQGDPKKLGPLATSIQKLTIYTLFRQV